MEKILAATTQDICMPYRGFVIFYEMNMLVGHMFDAFLEKRNRLNCPTFFATACGSESHASWWAYSKRELLKAKRLAGELQVAGFSVLPDGGAAGCNGAVDKPAPARQNGDHARWLLVRP